MKNYSTTSRPHSRMIGEATPTKKSRFISKLNALMPLFNLGAACFCIALASKHHILWDTQGFIFVIGILLGNSGTGALTQKDE